MNGGFENRVRIGVMSNLAVRVVAAGGIAVLAACGTNPTWQRSSSGMVEAGSSRTAPAVVSPVANEPYELDAPGPGYRDQASEADHFGNVNGASSPAGPGF